MTTKNKKADKGYRSVEEFKKAFFPEYFKKEIEKRIIQDPASFSNYIAGVFIKKAKQKVPSKAGNAN